MMICKHFLICNDSHYGDPVSRSKYLTVSDTPHWHRQVSEDWRVKYNPKVVVVVVLTKRQKNKTKANNWYILYIRIIESFFQQKLWLGFMVSLTRLHHLYI